MPSAQSYIIRVFKSIKANTKDVGDDEKLDRLVDCVRNFYVSLFATGNRGIFPKKCMDKRLATKAADQKQPATTSSTSLAQSSAKTKGLGKGSPGVFRKQNVSQRQKRRRDKMQETHTMTRYTQSRLVTIAPRPPRSTSTITAPPSTSTITAPPSTSTITAPPSTSTITAPPSNPNTDIFGLVTLTPPLSQAGISRIHDLPTIRPPSLLQPSSATILTAPEKRVDLRPQVIIKTKETRVKIIQRMAEASRDSPPNQDEMKLYWLEMDYWERLDARLVAALAQVWNDASQVLTEPSSEQFLRKLMEFDRMANGVRNCTAHFIGSIVRKVMEVMDQSNEQLALEKIVSDLQCLSYKDYLDLLKSCQCPSCSAVIEFDRCYERYHDEVEQGVTEHDEIPKYENRPMHCSDVEPRAQSLQSKFSGFSVTTLQNKYYFANSTPPMSPPTISTSTATHVMTTVNKYMEFFLRERRIQDPLPSSWLIPSEKMLIQNFIPIEKDSIHFYDGDSAEIYLSDSSSQDLLPLATHGMAIRIRMKNHDAPEMKFAVRTYRQPEGGIGMQSFVTRHIGVESLRAIRESVFEADRIYIENEKDSEGKSTILLDRYRRRLMNVFIETKSGSMENLAEIMAERGYTLSYYTAGINRVIDSNMRQAIAAKRGIFSLPQDVFAHPYRPWDLRREWPDVSKPPPKAYEEFKEIVSPPHNPEEAWRCDATPMDEEDLSESQHGDSYFFRVVPSKLHHESLCFKSRSTIDGAGNGLFLRPHGLIPKGSYLCMYSAESTTEDEIEEAGSSRHYAIMSGRERLWFDAEMENGNNLGRFANQLNVLETLRSIKETSAKTTRPEFFEADWKEIEDQLAERRNADFKVIGGQMVLCASCDLQPSQVSHEVFVSYGSLRSYWINAIANGPGDFPSDLSNIVEWLLHSPDCNWTDEQRRRWSTQ